MTLLTRILAVLALGLTSPGGATPPCKVQVDVRVTYEQAVAPLAGQAHERPR